MAEMTPKLLTAIAKKHDGYANPLLNDVLFLHYQGFIDIQNLEPYAELKVLWLEHNAIENIQGLTHNVKLVTLYLQNNAIRRIDGLQSLSNLRILNLSNNYIGAIKNIAEYCPLLESLEINHNQIESLDDCLELHKLTKLSSLNLSFNKIERPQDCSETYVFDFFSKMPSIAVLYLHGQPLCIGVKNYRKNMVYAIKTLTYLDERPIFDDERRAVEAWGVGGAAAESAEREAIRKEKHDHLTSCVRTLAEMAERMKDVREARTIEYERQREAERKRQQDNLTARRDMTYDEDDARIIIETDESGEWVDLVDALGKELLAAQEEDAVRQQELEEQRAVEMAAQKEIDREEATLDALVEAAECAAESEEKAKRREEVAYWVKQMEMTDEEIITQMEDEMTEMLKMMRPAKGYKDITSMAAAAVAAAPEHERAAVSQSADSAAKADRSPSKSALREQRAAAEKEKGAASARHVDPMATESEGAAMDGKFAAAAAAQEEARSLKNVAVNKGAGDVVVAPASVTRRPKFSKERVWAQYDAWESLQLGRRGKVNLAEKVPLI